MADFVLMGLALVVILLGFVIIAFFPERPGGAIRILGMEASSRGPGLIVMAMGVGLLIFMVTGEAGPGGPAGSAGGDPASAMDTAGATVAADPASPGADSGSTTGPPALDAPPAAPAVVANPPRALSRRAFYHEPHLTVAHVPGARTLEEAVESDAFVPIPESGAYRAERASHYCFALNHRSAQFAGRDSYLGVGVWSILAEGMHPDRPVSLYRNPTWFRPDDSTYVTDAPDVRDLDLPPGAFFAAHSAADALAELDRRLGYRWHGHYDPARSSFDDRDRWQTGSSVQDALAGAIDHGDADAVRFDALLLRFAFTAKDNSENLVAFCVDGDRRERVIIRMYVPDLGFDRELTLDVD